jgi:DNA-directed RNA polymerase subunit RPC12/RpoP
MAMREYQCADCGHITNELFDSSYPSSVECENCGATASFKFSTFRSIMVFRDGYDWGAGEYFDTQRQRDNYLAEHNLRKVHSPPKGNVKVG